MNQSSKLNLPYLAAGQAQKHVTVNESLLRLDALVQLTVISASISEQPAAPVDGDCYILPAGKSGADWAGMANAAIAYYRDGAWEEITPREGWRCFVQDAQALFAFSSGAWRRLATVALETAQLVFTPGGDGAVSFYRCDTSRNQNPRTATISSIAGDVITLTAAVASLFFDNTRMAGVAMVRVWNTSKTAPGEPAWVIARPATNQLQVLDAASIAGWTSSETLQIGDPTPAVTPTRAIAIDISPMLQNVLGAVFPQKGVLLKYGVAGSGLVGMAISGTAASGSFTGVSSLSTGGFGGGVIAAATTVLSPVSNSNLVYLREDENSALLGLTLASMIGVYV